MTEQIDIIDDNNHALFVASKDQAHSEGLPHRVSAVLIQRPDGKLLVPTAAEHKPESGRLYHSAAGHVTAGEDYLDAAVRELAEETGVSALPAELIELGTYWLHHSYTTRTEHERFQVYLYHCPENTTITLNEEQVNPAWYSKDELSKLYQEEPDRLSLPLQLTYEKLLKVPSNA